MESVGEKTRTDVEEFEKKKGEMRKGKGGRRGQVQERTGGDERIRKRK